jgi:hypothetical protein
MLPASHWDGLAGTVNAPIIWELWENILIFANE